MASEGFHEPLDRLSVDTQDMHRALISLQEELEAVDWYQQRAEATEDEALRRILAHNRDEEKEHALMVLEWIRRKDPAFDRMTRVYLFSEGEITAIEAEETAEDTASSEVAIPPSMLSFTVGSLIK
jgi:hypothetical protein